MGKTLAAGSFVSGTGPEPSLVGKDGSGRVTHYGNLQSVRELVLVNREAPQETDLIQPLVWLVRSEPRCLSLRPHNLRAVESNEREQHHPDELLHDTSCKLHCMEFERLAGSTPTIRISAAKVAGLLTEATSLPLVRNFG
jgi:hypothetical protein